MEAIEVKCLDPECEWEGGKDTEYPRLSKANYEAKQHVHHTGHEVMVVHTIQRVFSKE